MYLYNVPSVEAEIFDNPLKLLGTNSIFFPLAKSCTLKDEAVVVTTSVFTSGFVSGLFTSGFFTSGFFSGVLAVGFGATIESEVFKGFSIF